MKTKLCYTVLIFFCISALRGQSFQREVQFSSNHLYHDLNLVKVNDGSNDFVVAGNVFDPSMSQSKLSLKRMDDAGNLIWAKTYADATLQNARVLDIANMFDFIALTGHIDVNGKKHTFIAKIEAATGNVLAAKYYDIVSPNFNSSGLHIAYTNSDATGDTQPNPGFVVGGYFGSCYALDYLCNLNIGFVLRVDDNLNVIWTTELDTSVNAVSDYDFINKITETADGFFLTGSATTVQQNNDQQAVLAYHIDRLGNTLWNASYVYGNSRDVSVDAYQEPTTGNIYMLANYSSSHNFGITVFDPNGNIINNLSWAINSADLNRYGFSLRESVTSFNNLVIFGYDREETWTDPNTNNNITGQSNVFVYEFEKATGNPVAINYQYLTPHTEAPGDEYNFWNAQLPLIYYPDMAIHLETVPGTPSDYLTVGYYSPIGTPIASAEITKTSTKQNSCDAMDINLSHTAISVTPVAVSAGLVTTTDGSMNFVGTGYTPQLSDCTGVLGTTDHSEQDTGTIYPNPAQDILNVSLEKNTIASVAIYSIQGQLVGQKRLMDNTRHIELEVAHLRQGIYFLTVMDAENRTQTFKFVKK